MSEETEAGKAREAWMGADVDAFAALIDGALIGSHNIPAGNYRWRFRDGSVLAMSVASMVTQEGTEG